MFRESNSVIIKDQIYYFKLAAFSLPNKLSKSIFSCVKFRAKFEVVLQKTISVDRCESLEIRLFHRKSLSRWRGNSSSMLQRNSLKYRNDRRGNFYFKLQRDRHRLTRYYSTELQRSKQTLTTSKNLNLLLVTFLAIER